MTDAVKTLDDLEELAFAAESVQLPPDDWEKLARDVKEAADRIYALDPWLWLMRQTYTQDEASQERRTWPDDKPHLRDMIRILQSDERKIAFPKSRRRMATWLVAGWCLHRARFFPGNAIYIQSEVEEKAAFVVDRRCLFLERSVPGMYQRPYSTIKTVKGAVGQMTFENGSYIKGVAQGSDVLRTYTPSVIVMDESEFQEQGRAALVAALPFAEKKTKLILISSSNGPIGPLADIAKTIGFVRFGG